MKPGKSVAPSESPKELVLSPKVYDSHSTQVFDTLYTYIVCLYFQEKMKLTLSDIVSQVLQCLTIFDSPMETKVHKCMHIVQTQSMSDVHNDCHGIYNYADQEIEGFYHR